MKNFNILLFMTLLQTFGVYAIQKEDSTKCSFSCCRPDAMAPAGIMIDHVHDKGKFALAYSFMDMSMQGNQIGTRAVSNATIFNTYLMATNRMDMQMHMIMPMYGITDRLTAMAMFSYNVNRMDMTPLPTLNPADLPPCCKASASTPNVCKSSGFGDTKLYLLYNLLSAGSQRLVMGAGVSLPTGSIHAKGATVQSNNDVLPYCMQLGTGSYDLLPSLAYTLQMNRFTVGAACQGNIKLGANTRAYHWGNEYSFSPWASYQFARWISTSLRAEYYSMDKLYGYDVSINQSSLNDATANVNNYGGQRGSGYIGINLYAPGDFLKGSRLLLECGMPFYQNTFGLQPSVKATLTARLQFNF